jgi:hypothetical protein
LRLLKDNSKAKNSIGLKSTLFFMAIWFII